MSLVPITFSTSRTVLTNMHVVQLVMPMPIMIWLAVIVEAAIANWLDMIILLLIQFINASIGWYALNPQHIERRIHNGGCCHSAAEALALQLLAPF
jgi:hypothetical protein